MMTLDIRIKRVYEPADPEDGARFLVDRLWPRGISRDSLKMDGWVKDVAPSNELRHWFGHDRVLWDGFQQRYAAELDANPPTWQPLLDAARQGPITLLFSSREVQHNNAVALRHYLISKASALP
jgi:uncharacterized protein YeaO (DUF488 family)